MPGQTNPRLYELDFLSQTLLMVGLKSTQNAALHVDPVLGRGDGNEIDGRGLDAMWGELERIPHTKMTVIICEGEKDEAPMFKSGQVIGDEDADHEHTIAFLADHVDGTTKAKNGDGGAISVCAMLISPDRVDPFSLVQYIPSHYCIKLAIGAHAMGDNIDPEAPIPEILQAMSANSGIPVKDLWIVVLDRPQNKWIVDGILKVGARHRLISAGDIAPALAASMEDHEIDGCFGRGGSTEGLLAAAGIINFGGGLFMKPWTDNDEDRRRWEAAGCDFERFMSIDELVKAPISMFMATGITDSLLVKGIRKTPRYNITHSFAIRSRSEVVDDLRRKHPRGKKRIFLHETQREIVVY